MTLLEPGIYNIHKPKGPTSRQILNRLKSKSTSKKIGHAGTLDPLADGVLIVAIGREYTKKINQEVNKSKEYKAIIKLGETSSTDDEEGEKTQVVSESNPELSLDKIKQTLTGFSGEIEQIPPIYSAVKVKGQEAYKLARQGKKVDIKSKRVYVYSIEILDYNWPMLTLKVITGPGCYIRSLARDIGEALQVGGYLQELTRTKVGDYVIENSIHID